MIQCPECDNADPESLHQFDSSLAGYREYGRKFFCLACRKNFYIPPNKADDDIIARFYRE